MVGLTMYLPCNMAVYAPSLSIFPLLAPAIMGREKDPEATLRRAREKGYKANRVIVNNNAVLKKLKSQTERNYRRKLNL